MLFSRLSYDLSWDCQNQKWHVPLEAGQVGAHSAAAHVEMGLMEGCKSIFEQSDLRALSTPQKDTVKMVDNIFSTIMFEPIIKEK